MNVTSPTEETLVRALQNHQSTDFTLIYNSFAPALYGVLLRLVKDPERAEDLLQDAFVKVWSNSHTYNPKQGRLFTWLLTITRNLAMDELRARKVRAAASTYIYEHVTESMIPVLAEGMSQQSLLSSLSPKYQPIVELMYYRDYTSQEVADTLKLPLGTVKTRVRMALQQLRQFFNQDIQQYHGAYRTLPN